MKKKSLINKIAFISLIAVVFAVFAVVFYSAMTSKDAKRSSMGGDGDGQSAYADGGISQNILFMGNDDEAGLCDVMILANVDFDLNRATVMQIPRDTYASYSSGNYKKINGIYRTLGAKGAVDFLSDAFGIDIDGYVCINLSNFRELVDAVGGVDINLPCDMVYDDSEQGLHINLKKGKVHLDGSLAEQFVRFRSGYVRGDIDRMDAQKLFLASFFKKCADEFSPIMALKLSAAADGIETNMSIGDMLSIGVQLVDMKAADVQLLTLPGSDAVADESGASYYVLCRASCGEVIAQRFGKKKNFDKNKAFLNSKYKSFKKIYEDYVEYDVKNIEQIVKANAS